MDPTSQTDLERLKRVADRDEQRFQWLRDLHREITRELAGGHYGDERDQIDRPYNEIGLIDLVYKMQLIGERPQVLITSPEESLRPFAEDFEAVFNKYLEDEHVEESLRHWVGDALCSIGILYVGEGAGSTVEILEGVPQASVVHFVDNIPIDDFGFDCTARRWDRCNYLWWRSRVPLEEAKDGTLGYEPAVANRLLPTYYTTTNEDGSERSDAFGIGDEDIFREDVVAQTTVRNYWLPATKQIVTVSEQQPELGALKTIDWQGPKNVGPIHILQFDDLSGHLLCRPPLADALDLHKAENESITRLIEQNEGQKNIALTDDEESGEQIRKTPDGGQATVANPEAVKPFSYPGPDQQRFAFTMKMGDWLNRIMGNVDAMGNLAPNAPTLGQEQMIRAGINDRMAKMGYRFVRKTEGVITHLAYLIWTDPLRDMRSYEAERTVTGTDLSYTVDLGGDPTAQDDWAGDLMQYDFRIDPYSSTYQSPAERLMQLEGFLQRIVLPNLPLIMQQGGQFNWQEVIALYARYLSMPEYKTLLTWTQPYQEGVDPTGGGMPQTTERINTRRSIPGTTPRNQDDILIGKMMGQTPQDSQMAALGR